MGLSPAGLVGSLHGSGTMTLANAHFAGIDTAAFDAAIHAADQSGSIETPKIQAAVSAAMENGRLTVPQGNAEVTITAGQIRLAKVTLPAQSGAELSLDGVLDLNSAAIDARMTLSGQPAANALIRTRPELALTVKGPLAAPETKLDISALVSWLTLRATELQTRRLELIEANRREDVLGPVVRPASPSVRYIPPGTTLETTIQANASAAPASGTRGLDRLRPEAPPAAPESRSDHGGTDHGAAAPRCRRRPRRSRSRRAPTAQARGAPRRRHPRRCRLRRPTLSARFAIPVAELTRPAAERSSSRAADFRFRRSRSSAPDNGRARTAVSPRTDCRAGARYRSRRQARTRSCRRPPAISFSAFQNASSRLTLVL